MGETVLYNVRLSYVFVWEPTTDDNGVAKYSVSVLIPKTDKKSLDTCNKAIEDIKTEAVDEGKLALKKIEAVLSPLHDGSADYKIGKRDKSYDGHMYFSARSKYQPTLVDRQLNPIIDEDQIYSGCWCNIAVSFYFTTQGGQARVAVGLNHIQKWRDDNRLDGRSNVEDVFKIYLEDSEEIELDAGNIGVEVPFDK